MFVHTMKLVAVATFLGLSTSGAIASEIDANILQYSHDRLYFDVGRDQLVFPHSKFSIKQDTLIILEGRIEASLPVVCYSHIVEGSFGTLSLEGLRTVIETAEVDSTSLATFVAVGMSRREIRSFCRERCIIISDQRAGEIKFIWQGSHTGRNPISIMADPDGRLTQRVEMDGFYSFTYPTPREGLTTISTKAPNIAILLPNLSSDINRGGYLTTSLYYRFDESMLPHLFSGQAEPVFCFARCDSTKRSYPSDRQAGRQLIANMPNRPTELTISASPNLENLAVYFADVLSRDRVKVTVVNSDSADVRLMLIPYPVEEAIVAIEYLVDLLQHESVLDKRQKEALEFITGHLESIAESEDNTTKWRHHRMIDRILIDDLGIFPLFRPRLFFTHGDNLLGVNSENCYDFSNLRKLILPEPEPEVAP